MHEFTRMEVDCFGKMESGRVGVATEPPKVWSLEMRKRLTFFSSVETMPRVDRLNIDVDSGDYGCPQRSGRITFGICTDIRDSTHEKESK